MRELAIMVAVAMGTPAEVARARLDVQYPEAVAPEPAADDVTGRREERRGDEIVTTEILADGREREVGRKPVPNLAPPAPPVSADK